MLAIIDEINSDPRWSACNADGMAMASWLRSSNDGLQYSSRKQQQHLNSIIPPPPRPNVMHMSGHSSQRHNFDGSIPVIMALPPQQQMLQSLRGHSFRRFPNVDRASNSKWLLVSPAKPDANTVRLDPMATAVQDSLLGNPNDHRTWIYEPVQRAVQKSTGTMSATNTAAFLARKPKPRLQYTRLAPVSPIIVDNIIGRTPHQSMMPVAMAGRSVSGGSGENFDLGKNVGALLSSGTTIENLTKFARNLLTLPMPDQRELITDLFSAVTGNKLSPFASAIIEPSIEPTSNIFNTQDFFNAFTKNDFAIGKSDNATSNDTETESILQNLPVDQRDLLKAAIQTGELDLKSLQSAIGNTSEMVPNKTNEGRLLEWIQQNRPKTNIKAQLSPNPLPYYGKYCGSFEGQTIKNRFNTVGTVWAADNQHFIVSKFKFNPGSLITEQVTFWAGPNDMTGDEDADLKPSMNGFYMKPQSLGPGTIHVNPVKEIEAKVRVEQFSKSAEKVLRQRRGTHLDRRVNNETDLNEQSAGDGSLRDENSLKIDSEQAVKSRETQKMESDNEYQLEPLGWYSGVQPLLLKVPSHKSIKTIRWFALWDHKRQASVAQVLIPHGSAFQIPSAITMRGLTPNGQSNVRSDHLIILDMKTIEISQFTFSGSGAAVWFLVGKDILPNAGGSIVPIYDSEAATFDCDSLRDYSNETVLLRLPASLEMKDVFWFSVFSMEQGISLSHIYLPYNDLILPPDQRDIPVSQ